MLCHLHIGIHREANYSSTTGSPCDHHHAMYGYGVKPYVRSTPWLATARSCSLRFRTSQSPKLRLAVGPPHLCQRQGPSLAALNNNYMIMFKAY